MTFSPPASAWRSPDSAARRTTAGRLAACLLAALSGSPASAANIHVLLRRSLTAERRLSYQGAKLLTRGGPGGWTAMATIYHRAPDQTLMTAWRDDGVTSAYLQRGRQHYLRLNSGSYHRLPLPPPVDATDLLFENYRLRQLRTEPIAGRKCVMVSISPKYPGSPRKVVWLDDKTSLALKTQVWSLEGRVTEESEFLRIQYGPSLEQSLFDLPEDADPNEFPEARPDFKLLQLRPGALPKGYRLVETALRRLPGGHVVSFQRYSDGLNTLTLTQSATHPNLESVRGRAPVSGELRGVHFALYGDQRPEALKKVAAALR
jgi:negative regulator of sigma E activity